MKSSNPGAVSEEEYTECGANTYSAAGAAPCEICPAFTSAPARSDALDDCKCLAGYQSNVAGQDGRPCSACQAGKHKALTGASPCIDCAVNRYSTTVAATSNATCLSCTQNAVSPVGSSALSQCLCDFGYRALPITNNIPNLTRSCGTGSVACAADVDSNDGRGRPAIVINDDKLDGSLDSWISSGSVALHWVRVDFERSVYVTGIQLAVDGNWFTAPDGGYTNAGIFVSANIDLPSDANSLCTIITSFTAVIGSKAFATYTCNKPMLGRYIFIHNRCNQGTVGVDRGNCNMMSIQELRVQGYTSSGVSCSACTAGTFKDTLGSAECTNCPANHYSGLTAQRSNATYTPCYKDSVSAPGNDNIDDCSCAAGFEFS
jgi:hypothetical protein